MKHVRRITEVKTYETINGSKVPREHMETRGCGCWWGVVLNGG